MESVMLSRLTFMVCCLSAFGITSVIVVNADDKTTEKVAVPSEPQPLNKSGTVLVDAKGKRLLLKSEVVLREGMLEMLACIKRTKEHEAILAVDAKAQLVHAGLLALDAEAGS